MCIDVAGERPWAAAPGGVLVAVRITPKGGRDAIEGIEMLADGRAVLKARVRAAPSEGAANQALVHLLADALDIAPRAVSIAAGATARIKRVKLEGNPSTLIPALEKAVEDA
jgi:uncharacterized protein (TIGR00251 family)